jgi:hypothetical protein
MPGSTTKSKARTRDSIVYNGLDMVPFTNIVSAATQVPATIQDALNLPVSCKILGAAVYYKTIGSTSGTYTFNVVAGVGTYETAAGTYATDFGTVAGTVQTGDVITMIFTVPNLLINAVGGPITQSGILGFPPVAGSQQIPFVYTVKSTDTTATVLAASIIAAFNASKLFLADIVYAWNAGNTLVNFTTLQCGNNITQQNAANAITLVAAVTTNPTPGSPAATTTFVVNALTFAGDTFTTGVVPGINDQFEYTGAYNFAPAGSGTLAATPIFNTDMPIFLEPQGGMCYWSSNFDVIYQQGSTLTLRLTAPGTAITNFKVTLLLFPVDVLVPNPTFFTFDPHNDIG